MTSLCTQYYQFLLAQGILLGASNAFLFCPAMATVSHLFDKHRSTATGVMISGSSIGGIIWPIMLERLLNQDGVSFGWSFRIVGFVVVAFYITIVVTIRMPPKAAPHIEAAEDKTENSSQEQDDQSTAKSSDVSIIKNPTFLVLCAGLSIATFGLFNPLFYISTYAVSRGLSASLSFYLVSILNGASLVGRVSTGILADKYGNFNLCFLTVACSGIIAMCWTKATTTAEIIVFALAYGYTSGVSIVFASESMKSC
jgi:MFS family permease